MCRCRVCRDDVFPRTKSGLAPALIAGALIAGGVTLAGAGVTAAPVAHATVSSATAERSAVDARVVSVGVGAGVTLDIDAVRGTARISSSVGLAGWDSTIADSIRYKNPFGSEWSLLGRGWTWGASYLTPVDGSLSVYLPGEGEFVADPASPTGLRGYDGDDVHFSLSSGALPARGGVVPEREYIATLAHLDSGVIEYFSADGEVLTAVGTGGARTDRLYGREDGAAFLVAVIDPQGAKTTLDFSRSWVEVVGPEQRSSTNFAVDDAGRMVNLNSYARDADDTPQFAQTLKIWYDGDGVLPTRIVGEEFTGEWREQTELEWGDDARLVRVVHNDEVVFER